MGMDLSDQRYFEEKFGEVRRKIDQHTEILHKRISDHAEKDERTFKEAAEKAFSLVKAHEDTFHNIGAGKIVVYIGGILGIIAGIIAIVKIF